MAGVRRGGAEAGVTAPLYPHTPLPLPTPSLTHQLILLMVHAGFLSSGRLGPAWPPPPDCHLLADGRSLHHLLPLLPFQ
ncbi:hypothetical protein E2C01_095370 [Portunus trituberculatus]|uniref:Uncharacterized protein n=1 Tax=Portunus trituberculatus TaxID=210409 RepID=A0A5B7JZZ2_PORTR|nr:hypothetical protein [Portunus trituberculatus]